MGDILARPSILKTVLAAILAASEAAGSSQQPMPARVRTLESGLAAQPDRADLRHELASALLSEARRSGSPELLARVEAVLEAAPTRDFLWEKDRAGLLLARENYSEAREKARELNRRAPDDLDVYQMLVEACRQLGEYAEAEKAAQWMLDLRPDDPRSLTSAAALRMDFGESAGAVRFYGQALRSLQSVEPESRAALLADASLALSAAGEREQAGKAAREARKLDPESRPALLALAAIEPLEEAAQRLREAAGRSGRAADWIELAALLERAGRTGEAARVAAERFPGGAGAGKSARSALARWFLLRAEPRRALELTEALTGEFRDSSTLFLHARALAACGRKDDARAFLKRALAPGARTEAMLALSRELSLEVQ